MKTSLIASAALALLFAGCASPTLVKEPHWEKAQGPAVEEAKAGKFKASMGRMMEVSQYLFETEGYLFTRRDDDTKTFTTDPFKLPGSENPHSLQLVLSQGEGGVVSAAWTHLEEVKYKNEDACKGKPECQKALSDDWNWRLFKHLP